LYIFSKLNVRNEPYLLVVGYNNDETENMVFQALGKHIGAYKIKSKTKTPGSYELTVEIRAKADKSIIVNILDALDGVTSVAMISYDGEYAA
ncbi:MAG: DUF4956 domain-containing protein, partial [Eubacteriales bacterium]|nr:DUF4956 domain-containing protein [Eubacteriales bacterium]